MFTERLLIGFGLSSLTIFYQTSLLSGIFTSFLAGGQTGSQGQDVEEGKTRTPSKWRIETMYAILKMRFSISKASTWTSFEGRGEESFSSGRTIKFAIPRSDRL